VVRETFLCEERIMMCAPGQFLFIDPVQELCNCTSCTTLANISSEIAQYISGSNCEWDCLNPYIRIADKCKSLQEMRALQSVSSGKRVLQSLSSRNSKIDLCGVIFFVIFLAFVNKFFY
jgi:hypothetical protein